MQTQNIIDKLSIVQTNVALIGNAHLELTNSTQKIHFLCKGCSSPTYKSLRDACTNNKYWCDSCRIAIAAKKRINPIEKIKAFVESRNCQLVSDTPIKSHDLISIKCLCGNTYQQTLSDFRSIARAGRKNQCQECSRKAVATTHLYTLDYVIARINETGCRYVKGDYESCDSKLTIECRRCNQPFVNTWKDFYNNGSYACAVCTCNSVSEGELEIGEFLLSKQITFETNNRTIIAPYELDVLMPTQRVAIEYNGIYFHSEKAKRHDSKYHLNKTLSCEKENLSLLHIWDFEWKDRKRNKKDIWKSIICSKIGAIDTNSKIHARKCTIKKLNSTICNEFLNSNHLQGEDRSSIRYGLYFNDELVQVMTFAKPRFNKNVQYEMVRSCCKKYHMVIGGTSKLFAHFIKVHAPSSVISYADLRYAVGKSYLHLGFTFSHYSPPSYHYTKNGKSFNRIQFQRHKLSKVLEKFDNSLSERDNMINNGYYRYWDCGCGVFIWSTKTTSELI